MKSILFVEIIAALGLAMTTAGLGYNIATAQMMADNATMSGNMTAGNMTMDMGNMTGGNMTMDMGNSTDASGSISGVETPFG